MKFLVNATFAIKVPQRFASDLHKTLIPLHVSNNIFCIFKCSRREKLFVSPTNHLNLGALVHEEEAWCQLVCLRSVTRITAKANEAKTMM